MIKKILEQYVKDIHHRFLMGDATEESYYECLKELVLQTALNLEKSFIDLTILPKKTEGGNPDIKVWHGKSKIVGYIEAKSPKTELDEVDESEQLRRYRDTFPNLILTNFLEFRFYRDGELVNTISIGRRHTLVKVGAKPAVENVDEYVTLFDRFFSFTFPQNLNARRLAKELAKRTRFLRDQVVLEELKSAPEGGFNYIKGFYEAFKKYLIIGLTEKDFADLYSQTVTYGLFAARTRCVGEFHRENAVKFIPQSIGFLHDVFNFLSTDDSRRPKQLECIIDDIADVLASVNVNLILNEYFHDGKGDDPVVHFYETFLSEYDPSLRELRGVYYTPEPVVSFIVNSLHSILKTYFDKPDGLADKDVKVLDPAAGTLTFVAEAAKLALKEYTGKYGEGVKERFVRDHLLKNYFAFELMMAPYAIGHLKMSYVLKEMGIDLVEQERFLLYLTNTLEMDVIEQIDLPGMSTLAQESRLAGEIKQKTPILVIMGNPPYSGISINKGDWIKEQIETYKYVDGIHFKERKHWLQDDYVKFIRFAQWKIDQNGEGVLGFITNHSYLDNQTFRGMRQSLMRSFNDIYVLDLHGNINSKEKSPDGSRDEGVFDIRQGVAISLFIKIKSKKECRLFHSEIWGTRDEKYEWLSKFDFNEVAWQKLSPTSPSYFFIPRIEKNRDVYKSFKKVTDIFPTNVTGIVTARDRFVIDFDKDDLIKRLEMFRNQSFTDDYIGTTFSLKDTRGWKLNEARKKLEKVVNLESNITQILYRPFDTRFIYYSVDMVDWGRQEVMRHMMIDNIGLITRRQMIISKPCNYMFISCLPISDGAIRSDNKGSESLFPLYIYPDMAKKDLFSHLVETGSRESNIADKIYKLIREKLNRRDITPEDIFYYIYGVLYSTIYREKYEEFLRCDFPRIPFTSDYNVFCEMGKLGEQLAAIHLMKSPQLNRTFARFEETGGDTIEKVTYNSVEERVYINKNQYFSHIPPELWEYMIGGYQVLYKWLNDRKKRQLSLDDIQHYIKIACALRLTIQYQEKIDEIYERVEENLIQS